MKSKVKRIRKAVGMVLAIMLFVNIPIMEAEAAEQYRDKDESVEVMECSVGEVTEGYFEQIKNARTSLSDCIISVGFSSEGMDIDIMTTTNATVPVVGIKDIRVEQKVWYGWKLVAVSSGAEVTDSDGLSVHVVFKGAIKDKTYRVTCVHYADLEYDGVEEYTECYANTGEFVFTY